MFEFEVKLKFAKIYILNAIITMYIYIVGGCTVLCELAGSSLGLHLKLLQSCSVRTDE